jgi:eukaryotic-like serine/threonine-protein kinase
MNRKHFFIFALLLMGIILSGCGSPAEPAFSTNTPAVPTALPTTVPPTIPPVLPTTAPTEAPTGTVALSLAAGEVQVSPVDDMEMVYIPAGEFSMGSTVGTADEQPVHTVSLDPYFIDKTEVTNDMYHQCVQNGPCLRPMIFKSNTHANYYFDPLYGNFPVIALKWSSAETYCSWAGRRLPTEAEWEYAARGTDGRTYPWGNTEPNASLLNFNNPTRDTSPVDDYKLGASPFGVLNMAGNVSEWVADWYAADYYASSPSSNPTGPSTGQYRVLRGSSFYSDVYTVRSADRFWTEPDTRKVTIGFRCALTP